VTFSARLKETIRERGSYVCVGLDTDSARIPDFIRGTVYERIVRFNREIIEATAAYASAYKLNSAFYEAAGPDGFRALCETIRCVPDGALSIVDAKRGDIGNTAAQYARAVFDLQGADAVTLNPYMGFDSIEPFLAYEGKGCFVLCLTSNRGADDFQKLEMRDGEPLYREIARAVVRWNTRGNLGIVAGATRAAELAAVREIAPEAPLLIPGIGTQGGDLEKTVAAGIGRERAPALVNSSRGIIYCSAGRDFAEAAGGACKRLRDAINSLLDSPA